MIFRRICIYYACGFEGRKESAGDLHNGKPATEVQNSALFRPLSCAYHAILLSPGYASETALQCAKLIRTCPQNTRLPKLCCASFVWLCLYLFGAERSGVNYRMLNEKTIRSQGCLLILRLMLYLLILLNQLLLSLDAKNAKILSSWLHLEGQEKSVAWSHKSPAEFDGFISCAACAACAARGKHTSSQSSRVHSSSPAPMNCPTSGWLARLCSQTSPLGEPAGNATRVNIVSLFVNTTRHSFDIKTVQIHSAQVATVLNCFPKEHANNMAFRWRIGNNPELSMCPPSPILYFAAACLRHQGNTTMTQCEKIPTCHRAKRCIFMLLLWLQEWNSFQKRPLGLELFWRWLATLSWQESMPHVSQHVKAYSGLSIGFSPEHLNELTFIWICYPHPHLMEFSRS